MTNKEKIIEKLMGLTLHTNIIFTANFTKESAAIVAHILERENLIAPDIEWVEGNKPPETSPETIDKYWVVVNGKVHMDEWGNYIDINDKEVWGWSDFYETDEEESPITAYAKLNHPQPPKK